MGATYKDYCHASELEAAQAMCGGEFPRTSVGSDDNLRVQTCTAIDGSTVEISTTVPATAASAVVSVPVAFTACDPDQHYYEITAIWGLGIVAVAFVYMAWAPFGPLFKNQ